ncbi:kelch-like protein 24 [Physella acuta]|uniref:kelch-like protein 24 n=1 Tax=Physella acuta TaxID=109671 RepID=UPI0027DAF130|nr:kelch-like protein 24 [Physella acuta]
MYKSISTAHNYDAQMGKEIFKCFEKNMDIFTDFTVNVGDFQFSCHKFVLSSCSGFFEALLRTDMREKYESSCTIEGISPEIFGLILDVIYKGTDVLDEENMVEMWHASNQLQIEFLVSSCQKFVNENITLQNYWSIYEAAKLLNSFGVLTKVKKLIVNNYPNVVGSDDFMEIPFEEFKDLLKHFRIVGDFVVNSVLKWAYSDDSYLTPEPEKCIGLLRVDIGLHNALCKKVDVGTEEDEKMSLRRLYLGQLFSAISLKDISTACLSNLLNNTFVIDNKDAITLVNKQAASRLEFTKPALFKNYRTATAIKTPPPPARKVSANKENPVNRVSLYFDIPLTFQYILILLFAAFLFTLLLFSGC